MITLSCPDNHVIIGQPDAHCKKGGFYNDTIGECKRVCERPEIGNADIELYQPARIGKLCLEFLKEL